MKPFPRRFVVDLDAMECYSEANHDEIALIINADFEAPTIASYIMGTGESRIRATEKLRLSLRLVQT